MKPLVTNEPWSPGLKQAWTYNPVTGGTPLQPRGGSTSPAKRASSPGKPLTIARHTAGGSYATATLVRLDDGMHDSVAQAYNRRKREDRKVRQPTPHLSHLC